MRHAASSVGLFQLPLGNIPTTRSPKSTLPLKRFIFVVMPVSSMTTKREAFSVACSDLSERGGDTKPAPLGSMQDVY